MSMGLLTGKTLCGVLVVHIVCIFPGFAHSEYHLNVLHWGNVGKYCQQGRARALASSLLGKYGFGGEPGLTCASSLNGVC